MIEIASAWTPPAIAAEVRAAASPQRFANLSAFRNGCSQDPGSPAQSSVSASEGGLRTSAEAKVQKTLKSRHRKAKSPTKVGSDCSRICVLEDFFHIRKRICLDQDSESLSKVVTCASDTSSSLSCGVETSCQLFKRPAGNNVNSNDAPPADLLCGAHDLADAQASGRIDIDVVVDEVGQLQIQELPLQPGETTAVRTLTLRLQGDSQCEWRLWGDDAQKHGEALRGQRILIRGAKLHKFGGKSTLNGCIGVEVCVSSNISKQHCAPEMHTARI
jgi:hypothetical protein